MSPPLTLFFLQASRSIRTAWLLEELGQSDAYAVEFADRVQQKAPQEFKDRSGNPLGKFPSIRVNEGEDAGLSIYESGAITEYLCEKYDTSHTLYPTSQPARSRAQIWLHAAEGAFMLHALAITYARWNFPKALAEANPNALGQMEEGLSVNVRKDFDWLEKELGDKNRGGGDGDGKGGPFLLGGERPTVADVMMEFSVDFIKERGLGIKDGAKAYPNVLAWLEACHATESYKRAVKKTGHTLHPKTT